MLNAVAHLSANLWEAMPPYLQRGFAWHRKGRAERAGTDDLA